jgi:short-subunit dehydrogenase
MQSSDSDWLDLLVRGYNFMKTTAIITGGAGAIGVALGSRLVKRGYHVTLVDKDPDRLAEAVSQLGGNAEALQVDLQMPSELARLADWIKSDDTLALLVNCAGTIRPGDVVDLPFQDLEQHIAVNLLAPMRLTQAAAIAMSARKTGCILSVVSAAGLVALPGSAAYSASKFGLRGFLIAISQELSQCGVKVRGVFPGAVDTPMLRYEATHGGSVFNFLNKDVLTAADVAAACLKAIDGNRLETHLPFWDSVIARIMCVAPGLMRRVVPLLQKQGEAGLQRFLASRGLRTHVNG